uniref:Uncharacterized protein n=1 Tax=Compsopogon caeruleus TaxID=31354 RepID=A0A7S1XEE3_9RHOD|mmetsp:Transcript_17118/g.35626  ORF Transcript_17118/g.35626 Transcript_17118/m.35626 type:complete len:201 (+) Transcript_17118:1931-2533(+)
MRKITPNDILGIIFYFTRRRRSLTPRKNLLGTNRTHEKSALAIFEKFIRKQKITRLTWFNARMSVSESVGRALAATSSGRWRRIRDLSLATVALLASVNAFNRRRVDDERIRGLNEELDKARGEAVAMQRRAERADQVRDRLITELKQSATSASGGWQRRHASALCTWIDTTLHAVEEDARQGDEAGANADEGTRTIRMI